MGDWEGPPAFLPPLVRSLGPFVTSLNPKMSIMVL